jgi:parallel beta-helix repeat protein
MKCLYTILLLVLTINMFAQTYYISNSGSGDNDGLSEATPWDLETFNQTSVPDGSTILFKKGDVFRGEVSSNGFVTGLHFSSYGQGNKPLFKGSIIIDNWTVNTAGLGSNVYQSDLSGIVNENGIQYLYIDGEMATLARYPNVNSPKQYGDAIWLETDGNNASGTFYDQELADYGKPDDYWNAATLRLRSYSWTYTVGEITDYEASTGTIHSDRIGSNQYPGWGYFIDNKMEELDHPNEWYYDTLTNIVYVYTPDGTHPSNFFIEGSMYDKGIAIYWHEDNSIVENLAFEQYIDMGIYVNSSVNVSINNCDVSNCLKGFYCWNAAGLEISNCDFSWCFKQSIMLAEASTYTETDEALITENNVEYNAMYPVYCARYDGSATPEAIKTQGSGYNIIKNTIKNTCHAGIYLSSGGQNLIEKNTVDSTLLLLNDGGSIVLSDDGYSIIRNNFLSNAIGNVDKSNGWGSSSGFHHPSYGMGIGADPSNPDSIIVENNTIFYNHDVGIRYNGADNSIIRNNVLYGNHDDQVLLTTSSDAIENVSIHDNIMYSLSPHATCLNVVFTEANSSIELSNDNYFCNPYNRKAVKHKDVDNDFYVYSLEHWQNQFGFDQNSKHSLVRFLEYSTIEEINELFSNNTFDENYDGFGGSCLKEWATHPQLDGGCVKTTFETAGKFFSYSSAFTVEEGKAYRLKLSMVAENPMNFDVRFSNTDGTWEIIDEVSFQATTERENYEYIFFSPISSDDMKLILNGRITDENSIVYFDNIYLTEVEVEPNSVRDSSKLFANPSDNIKNFNLGTSVWNDLDGNTVSNNLQVNPWESVVLTYVSGEYADFAPLQTQQQQFILYPNPTNDVFYLDTDLQYNEIIIYDMTGTIVFKQYDKAFVNISSLKPGNYIVNIKTDKEVISKKILKL